MIFRLLLTCLCIIWCTMAILLASGHTASFITGSPLIFVFVLGQLSSLGFLLFHIDGNRRLDDTVKWLWIAACMVLPPAGMVYLGRHYLLR